MAEINQSFWSRFYIGPTAPVYKFDKKELLKTPDKKSMKEKTSSSTNSILGQQWQKVENNLYTQAVYYEPTRLAAFYDYESMEYTPEISAALIYMLRNLQPQMKMDLSFRCTQKVKELNLY